MNKLGTLMDLSGKTALITGGARGAGAAIVQQFAHTGANVAFTYHGGAQDAQALQAQLRSQGVQAQAFAYDQRDVAAAPRLLDEVEAAFGAVHFLVNNAGIYPAKPIADIAPSDWDNMLDCNAKGVFFLSREAAQRMRDGGAIVNISSINATNPAAQLAHYGISKAAVEMMTRGMAQAFGPMGVRVNCVAPGLIWKEGQEKFIPGWRESYCERAPLGRLVQGEDVGNACVFLCSPLSAAITGQVLTVDCGVLLAPCFDNR